jgi:hypothetical protein
MTWGRPPADDDGEAPPARRVDTCRFSAEEQFVRDGLHEEGLCEEAVVPPGRLHN